MQIPKITTTGWLIIGGVLLLIIIMVWVYFSGKSKGKQQGGINISNPVTDPVSGSSSVSESEIRSLAGELYNDMKGLNFFGHNLEPWQRLLSYSDTDFIRVNNEFNLRYQQSSRQSFKVWVENESGNIWWSTVKDTVLRKISKLNIR